MGRTRRDQETGSPSGELRVIGGRLRGRKLRYHGDPITRPMKDRVREAMFNLISDELAGRYVVDLFAGTGALGIEALSRGAARALLIERHVPTARIVAENLAALDADSQATVLTTSAFLWGRRDLPRARQDASGAASPSAHDPQAAGATPPADCLWAVFCSPPYAFYRERWEDLRGLLGELAAVMPVGSTLVVEADERFDFARLEALTGSDGWNVRAYPPAVLGVWRKTTGSGPPLAGD